MIYIRKARNEEISKEMSNELDLFDYFLTELFVISWDDELDLTVPEGFEMKSTSSTKNKPNKMMLIGYYDNSESKGKVFCSIDEPTPSITEYAENFVTQVYPLWLLRNQIITTKYYKEIKESLDFNNWSREAYDAYLNFLIDTHNVFHQEEYDVSNDEPELNEDRNVKVYND